MKNSGLRNLEPLVGYASLIGSIFTILFVSYAVYKSDWQINFITVSIALSIVIVLVVMTNMFLLRRYDKLHQQYSNSSSAISRLQEKIKDEVSAKTKIAQIVHNFSHEYRNVINEIHSDLIVKDYSHFESRKTSFRMFITYMLSNIKEIFDILTFDEVSVCIKILYKEKEEFLVKTFMRDNISYRERSNTENLLSQYPYYENTAFKNIMDPHCPDSYYLCNDLSNDNVYHNINNNWNKYYNACLVVPIRLLVSKQESNVIGFICVDNVDGNFDDKIAVDILGSFGDNCFHLFNLFNELQSQTISNTGGEN